MMITKESLTKAWYSIVVFFIIFNPPFIKGFSFTILFVLVAFIYDMVNINRIIYASRLTDIGAFLGWFALYLGYSCTISLINMLGNEDKALTLISNMSNDLVSGISLILISFYLMIEMIKKDYSLEDVIQIYVNAGLYQAIIAILCFIFPLVKTTLNTMMSTNSGSEKIARTIVYTSAYRNYGFASTLYDIFGFAMSILAILALVQAMNCNKRNYIYFVLISFAAILNARTSIVILGIGILIVIFKKKSNQNRKFKLFQVLVLVIAIVIVVAVFIPVIQKNSTNDWLQSGLDEIKALVFHGETIGYFDTLFSEFLIFPKGLFSVLLGTGMNPGQAISHNSDVGYIQNLWHYGIIGSILLYYCYLYIVRKAKYYYDFEYKCVSDVFVILIAIYLVKLNCLGYSQASVVFVPLSFFAMLSCKVNRLNKC